MAAEITGITEYQTVTDDAGFSTYVLYVLYVPYISCRLKIFFRTNAAVIGQRAMSDAHSQP